jgi:hypothetical protein
MKTKLKSIYPEFLKILLTSALTLLGGYYLFHVQEDKNDLNRLNDNSNKLIEIEMQYPYVLDSVYIASWGKHPNAVDDSSMRYTSYCEYLFDYMEDVCEYYHYDKKKLDNYIDIPSVIEKHKSWWLMPEQQITDDSLNSQDFYRFRNYMNTFYK